ncbi:MAG: GntR family transcriptional regulator [Christensenellaceae bacterium]|nr:GntR family transcriptional regulator [Christensenellaceae bacterium]
MALIDRESPMPAYYQIQMDLKDRILKGEWLKTKQLPSEKALSTEYEVSRITLRQALAELEKDGFIKKSRGKGAQICDNPQPFIHKLDYSLVSAIKSPYGLNVTAEILTITRFENTSKEVAQGLGIKTISPVIYLKRLFLLDEKPFAVGRSWLPAERFPDLDKKGLENNNRLSETLFKRYNVAVNRVEDSIEAIRPVPSDCKVLGVTYDSPMLSIKGISYDKNDIPIEYSVTLWVGDKVRFNIVLENTSSGLVPVFEPNK